MTLLAKRYATALYLAAVGSANGQQVVDQVGTDLRRLHSALLTPAVRALVTSPDVAQQERERVLQKLGANMHALVQNLFAVVVRRHRLEVLLDIQPQFRALVMAARGEVDGVVETPQPLSGEDVKRLTELAAALSGKKVALAVTLAPELIGGVRLRIGNELYDGSVKSALDQLEQRLLRVPV